MSQLTEDGRRMIGDIAQRYGLSFEAAESMARAVSSGGGTMAQFNIPELGGSGQWMSGGMTMVGDMFNTGLKLTVENLCGELSNAMAQSQFFIQPQTLAGASWWPAELGQPSSVGGQNQTRYAYFPQAGRIAFDPGNGQSVILLDTLNHQIGGWSQQQSAPGDPFVGISFSSQFGQFALSSLPRVGGEPAQSQPPAPTPATSPAPPTPEPSLPPEVAAPSTPAPAAPPAADTGDILGTIEKLAALRDAGALTEDEFAAKKADLLQRL
ncbi:MAG: SHOCT domain-containing protein [Pseudomonadota bacterium]